MTLDELVSSSRAGHDAPTAADKARVRAKLTARLAEAGAADQPPVSDVFPIGEGRTASVAVLDRSTLPLPKRRNFTVAKTAFLAAALFVGTASAFAAHGVYVARTRALPVASSPPVETQVPRVATHAPAPPPPVESPVVVPAPASPAPVLPTPPRASHATAPDSSAALSAEMGLVQDARDALQRGDADGALATLDRFNARFKAPTLAPEAAGLRILALCAAGRTDEAHARASTFLRRWPHSPMAARIEACAEGHGPKP